jgi:broad specificity phosphatase PhoE
LGGSVEIFRSRDVEVYIQFIFVLIAEYQSRLTSSHLHQSSSLLNSKLTISSHQYQIYQQNDKMAPLIHLVRHAEATHNTFPRNQNIHDPPLTALGQQESEKIIDTFPRHDRIGLILTSPLRRAIQTSLAGFSHIIDRNSSKPKTVEGIENGAQFRIYPLLQPGRPLPCDTGSEASNLKAEFEGADFRILEDGWAERGILLTDEEQNEKARLALKDLAKLLRGLEGGKRTDVVMVTHGINYECLDPEGANDWVRAGWKSYTLDGNEEDGYRLVLV